METIVIPKEKFIKMENEIIFLRNTSLYKRLLDFQKNIQEKKYTRVDLGF
jgi:hypothetical protein